MFKFNNVVEQVLLLGLLPILGGSRNLLTAVIVTAVFVLIALLSRMISRIIKIEALADSHWIFLLAFGISIAYVCYLATAYLYPEVYQYSGMYILLVGVTPLTYIGCKEEVSFSSLWKKINVFFVAILLVAFFRELIGFGSIVGRDLMEVGFAPLSIFGQSAGGFVILGTIWILFRLLAVLGKINLEYFQLEGAEMNE